jgi:ABC-type branched-subunit amino acid transport system ATPase component
MDAGRIIADGKPETVIADAAVIDAYIGRKALR